MRPLRGEHARGLAPSAGAGEASFRANPAKVAGEGIIRDLSLSGSYSTGNAPVSIGMTLSLQIFVPGDPVPLLIDHATVKWVKESEFGVDFDAPARRWPSESQTSYPRWLKQSTAHPAKDKRRAAFYPTALKQPR